MERQKRPYSLHTRPRSKKDRRVVWYAQFRDEDGAYSTAASTSCTRHDDAVLWAERELARRRDRRENVTFADYAEGFWKPQAPFATDRAAHGRPIAMGSLDIAEINTRNHLLPAWGAVRLADLTPKRIDAWLV